MRQLGKTHMGPHMYCTNVHTCVLSSVRLFVTPWTICSLLCSLFMGFSHLEYWSGLPFPSPGDLPSPGNESASLASPALAGGFFTTSTTSQVLTMS